MYYINKNSNKAKVYCKICNTFLDIKIPDHFFEKDPGKYPIQFQYIHGYPPHGIILYIDKNKSIRAVELGENIYFSEEICRVLLEQNILKGEIIDSLKYENTL